MTYGGCEVGKRAVEIQQVKIVNNINYAEAANTLQGQKGMGATDTISQSSRSGGGQTEEANTKTELDVDKLILFVAYVINCADQVKRKTENYDSCERS